jgi:tetratricopeptide (TPR) repeat protein
MLIIMTMMIIASTACSNFLKQDEQQGIAEIDTATNPQQETTSWSGKAVELFNQGNQSLEQDAEKAEIYFNQAILIEPKMEAAYFNLMKLYYVSENREKMQQIFLEAEKENLLSARILTLVGSEKRTQGQFKDAEKYYQLALKKDANYLVVLLNMAILQELYLHNLTTAESYYVQYQQQLITQGKEDKRVKNWLADIKRRIAKAEKEKT